MKRWMAAALCILLAFSLTGCSLLDQAYGRVSEVLWQLQQTFSAAAQPENQPEPRWVELESYDLVKQGFDPFIAATEEWLRQGLQDAENLSWNIHSLHLTLGTDGMPLTLTADSYAYRDGQFRQGCRMEWDAAAGRLHQEVNNVGTLMESDAESGADNTENPNLRPDLVAERLRALPCDDLQTARGTPLAMEFSAYSRPEAGQTVVDMANDPGGFDLALYQAGQYGKADGSPAWIITVRQTEDEDRAGTGAALGGCAGGWREFSVSGFLAPAAGGWNLAALPDPGAHRRKGLRLVCGIHRAAAGRPLEFPVHRAGSGFSLSESG
nr:hypothetical protein [Fournierella massiliensis]